MATNDLPDITEGAAKRLEAWVDSWNDVAAGDTTADLSSDLHMAVWDMEHAGGLLVDVRRATDALLAHLDEREVA